jgi:dihydroorotate dehydrogenase electron transfer subunit
MDFQSISNPNQKVLLIGGGIGCPPLLECAKQFMRGSVFNVRVVLGFVNKESVFYEDEFKQYGEVFISTDDGSYQTKGNVKTVIDQLMKHLMRSMLVVLLD